MATILEQQLQSVLCPGMHISKELVLLFEWIETREQYVDRNDIRTGYLYPLEPFEHGWNDEGRQGGTWVEFSARGNSDIGFWLGSDAPEVLSKICIFVRTGGDGSVGALWLAPDGNQKIVHLGSGSGSTLTCVLADSCIDFLRLLAIGYDEICCEEVFDKTLAEEFSHSGFEVAPNQEFRSWVESSMNVSIPLRGNEIVRHPDTLETQDPQDPFCRWVKGNGANLHADR